MDNSIWQKIQKMITLKNLGIFLFVVFIAYILSIPCCWLFTGQTDCSGYPHFYSSHTYYSLEITSESSNLSNVTLLLPLPLKNNIPYLTYSPASLDVFYEDAPPGFQFPTITIQDRPMLQIKTHSMKQGQNYTYSTFKPKDDSSYMSTTNKTYVINTRFPVGNESVFIPLSYNESLPAPFNKTVKTSYTLPVYSSFIHDGTGQASLSVSSRISGYNYWQKSDDYSLTNAYLDTYSMVLHGDGEWENANGMLFTGGEHFPVWVIDQNERKMWEDAGCYPIKPFRNPHIETPAGNWGGGEC